MTRKPEADPVAVWRNAQQAYLQALRRKDFKRWQFDQGEIWWSEYEAELKRYREAEKAFNAIPEPATPSHTL